MYNREKMIKETVILISTFKEREFFLHGCLYNLNKNNVEQDIIISYENSELKHNFTDLNITQKIQECTRTSRNLGECKSWGERLYKTLSDIDESKYKYVIFMCDDNWVTKISEYFKDIENDMVKYNADRIQLYQDDKGNNYRSLSKIDDKVSKINPVREEPWYLSHQASIWKLKSLKDVVLKDDSATKNERIGSNRCRDKQYNFYLYNNHVIKTLSINHSKNGIHENAKELYNEFKEYLKNQ
jgi:hypothetical protein